MTLLALALAVTACGGGGSGSNAPQPHASAAPVLRALSVVVLSNLSRAGLPFKVTVGSKTVAARSTVHLNAVRPGDRLRIQAAGYVSKTVTVPQAAELRVEMNAGPDTSIRYIGDLEAHAQWRSLYDRFVNAWAKHYVSSSQFTRIEQGDLDSGHAVVRVETKSVQMGLPWHFRGCGSSHRWAKTFKGVATVDTTTIVASPNGGVSRFPGITHLIPYRGLWTFFPTDNCSST